jgi:hypothetical protein
MFVQLNSMDASLREIAPELSALVVLTILHTSTAFLRLTPGNAAVCKGLMLKSEKSRPTFARFEKDTRLFIASTSG